MSDKPYPEQWSGIGPDLVRDNKLMHDEIARLHSQLYASKSREQEWAEELTDLRRKVYRYELRLGRGEQLLDEACQAIRYWLELATEVGPHAEAWQESNGVAEQISEYLAGTKWFSAAAVDSLEPGCDGGPEKPLGENERHEDFSEIAPDRQFHMANGSSIRFEGGEGTFEGCGTPQAILDANAAAANGQEPCRHGWVGHCVHCDGDAEDIAPDSQEKCPLDPCLCDEGSIGHHCPMLGKNPTDSERQLPKGETK